MKIIKLFTVILILLASASSLRAQTSNVISTEFTDWQKISLTTVNFDQDVKEFLIAGKEKYMSIYFRVLTGQVAINSLQVFYENGNKQDIAVNDVVKMGSNSVVLDLTGELRSLKKIVMKYSKVPNTDQPEARMEVWASRMKARR